MRCWVERIDSEVRNKPILLAVFLGLAIVVLYAPVAHHEFLHWDDNDYVTENPHVVSGITRAGIAWAFTETSRFYWQPVTWLSHMLDCQVFGIESAPHHLENVLFHVLNSVLLFLLLKSATGSIWRSWAVSALFALHPLTVESVAWVAERKSLLSAFFSLLMVAAYGWYVQQRGPRRYAVVMIAFLFALMAKPMAITMPLLLLLLDRWPLQRVTSWDWNAWTRLVVEKILLILMSVCSAALAILGQRATHSLATANELPVGVRLEQVLVDYSIYIRKLVFPIKLSPLYPYQAHWFDWKEVAIAGVVLLTISVIAFHRRVPAYFAFGWLFFVVALFPVSGWMPTGLVVIADRFAYIPAIGIFVAVVWAAHDISRNSVVARSSCSILFAAALILLTYTTRRQLSYWQDDISLFTRAASVADTPDPSIELKVGDSYLIKGNVDEALEHYTRSCALAPNFYACHLSIAEISLTRNDPVTALQHYRLAARYTTDPVVVQTCLVASGEAMMKLGDFERAERFLSRALSKNSSDENALRLMLLLQAEKSARH